MSLVTQELEQLLDALRWIRDDPALTVSGPDGKTPSEIATAALEVYASSTKKEQQ